MPLKTSQNFEPSISSVKFIEDSIPFAFFYIVSLMQQYKDFLGEE